MDIWRQQCDSPCVAAAVDFICRYALYYHCNAILSDAHHKACMGCGADGVCGAGHDAFHGIYTFFHGGADYAECFHRQPVESDSGSAGLFRQRQRTEFAVSGESYRDEPAMAEYALGIGADSFFLRKDFLRQSCRCMPRLLPEKPPADFRYALLHKLYIC